MFLAVILVCSAIDANTCQLSYNTEKVFITEQACQEDLLSVIAKLPENPSMVIKSGCLELPGESV